MTSEGVCADQGVFYVGIDVPTARPLQIELTKQARIKELEDAEDTKALKRDAEAESGLGAAFERQLMLNAEQAQKDKEDAKEAAEAVEIEIRKETVKREREEKKAADAIKKIQKDKEKAEKEAAKKAEEQAKIREAQAKIAAEDDKQMKELEAKIGRSRASLRNVESGTQTVRLARKNSHAAHPMLSLAKMGF